MCKQIFCVGTIWDLDDFVYPELEDYTSVMTPWNFYQIMKYQLNSSMKEMGGNAKVVKKPLIARNQYGIKVKTCCASCAFKDVSRLRRTRWCMMHRKSVEPSERCKDWVMSEALRELKIKD